MLSANWKERLRSQKATEWQAALKATISRLAGAHKRIVLVDDLPTFSFSPSRCKYSGRLGIPNRCEQPDQDPTASYMSALVDIVRAEPGVRMLHTYDLFCSAGVCSMSKGGELMFRDENHLTVTGSMLAGAALARQLAE